MTRRVHKPIKFQLNLEPSLTNHLKQLLDRQEVRTIANVTLAVIAVTGILLTAAAMPNAPSAFAKLFKSKEEQRKNLYTKMWRSFNNLKQSRTFEFVEENDGHIIYKLTKNGKERIRKVILEELTINKPKKWDGRWRLVIFDIPEQFKKSRNALSNKLSDLNFYQCQKSVWIHPFPCTEEIEFIKDFFEIKPFVKIFTVEEMTDAKTLYHFKNLFK